MDDNDLLEFYRAAEVFVYPSRAEGFGIPPLEAAALGTPVICSNTSGMEQFSFFGEYHIDPFDLDGLKTKLVKILQTPPPSGILEERSALIRQQYSWDRAAEALYESIIFAHKLRRS